MNKTLKNIIIFLVTIIILAVSHFWIGGLFPENVYYSDTMLLFFPPVMIFAVVFYFRKFRKYESAVKIIVFAGVAYYLFLWFLIIWGFGEMPCDNKYFFDLFTKKC